MICPLQSRSWRATGEMECGLCNDDVQSPVVRRLRQPVEYLKRIGKTGSDYMRRDIGEKSVIVASAASEALPGETEGDARDTDERLSKFVNRHNLRPRGFEKVKGAALQFLMVVNPDQGKLMIDQPNLGEKYRPAGCQRASENEIRFDFFVFGGVEHYRRRIPKAVGVQQALLHLTGEGRRYRFRQADTTFPEDFAKVFLFVRHASRDGG